ncbi:hypothetical protein [Tenacibaculum finnmarkense]|uniref:hypothetical protein n=1 Tax=Tenacibaculum finnmarkense TaxID=2781243 RepID=UPI001EFBC045|nr:hypothetical protein [Tenacibaculum finnmarkense]MCG8734783.1 hypothetical protein [Tenacibaculum finnmarkense]
MTRQKELGYKLGDVIWHNLDGYKELWDKADFDTKEKIINELGKLAIELTIPVVSKSVVCSHESYAYTLNNDAKICDDCDAIFE